MTAGFAYAGALYGPPWFALAGHWVEQEAGAERGSVIIRSFAHKSLSIMLWSSTFEESRACSGGCPLAGLTFVSCGKSTTRRAGRQAG